MIIEADFDEAKQSQLPAVELLINMGYEYLPREKVMASRENNSARFVLKDIAFKKLREINSYEHNSEVYKLTIRM